MSKMSYSNPLKFHIALSFSADSKIIASDIYNLLFERGINIYNYNKTPDLTGGILEEKIKTIYENSDINCMIWTNEYGNKTIDAVVNTEMYTIHERHIKKHETDTLFIIKNDINEKTEMNIANKFTGITYHSLKEIGIFGVRNFLIERLFLSYNYYDTDDNQLIFHPKQSEFNRGSISLCKFKIDPNYGEDKFWHKRGDIRVQITYTDKEILPQHKVYLIPSGRVTPLLSNKKILEVNKMSRKYKMQFSKKFISENSNKEMVGYFFYIFTENMEFPFIYNVQYDEYLCKKLFDKEILS